MSENQSKKNSGSGGSGLGSLLALGAAALIGGAITYFATNHAREEEKAGAQTTNNGAFDDREKYLNMWKKRKGESGNLIETSADKEVSDLNLMIE